uniref:ARAD1D33594p n=1 Tax=Blastobotrys adeninivorans TaxID=409370 RepID=A0A060TGU4_BLAAD
MIPRRRRDIKDHREEGIASTIDSDLLYPASSPSSRGPPLGPGNGGDHSPSSSGPSAASIARTVVASPPKLPTPPDLNRTGDLDAEIMSLYSDLPLPPVPSVPSSSDHPDQPRYPESAEQPLPAPTSPAPATPVPEYAPAQQSPEGSDDSLQDLPEPNIPLTHRPSVVDKDAVMRAARKSIVASTVAPGQPSAQASRRSSVTAVDRSEVADQEQQAQQPVVPRQVPRKVDEISLITYLDLSTSSSAQVIASTGRFPRWLQKCTSLQFLICKNAGLTVVDDWVSEKLTELRVLRLNDNRITAWPHHLASLMSYGNLQIVDLSGNPCLELQFRKSYTFDALYHEAASGQALTYNLIKKYKKGPHQKESPEAYMASILDADTVPNMPTPNIPLRKSATGLFSRRKKNSIRPDDELPSAQEPAEQQSLRRRPSTPLMGSETPPTPNPEELLDKNANTPDRWANQRMEQSELNRSKVVLQLLIDIHEIVTKQQVILPDPRVSETGSAFHQIYPSSSGTSTMGGSTIGSGSERTGGSQHARENSIDVLQSMLSGSDNKSKPIIPIARDVALREIEGFVEEEKQFIKLMEEFLSIYVDNPNPNAKRIRHLFKNLNIIYRVHTEFLLAQLENTRTRLRQGSEDPVKVMAELGDSIVKNSEHFNCYLDYAAASELLAAKVRSLRAVKPADNAAFAVYGGGIMTGGAQTVNVEVLVGEWLRSVESLKNHTLQSCTSYMALPYARLNQYRSFFDRLSWCCKEMFTAHEFFEALQSEINRRKPIQRRKNRYAELVRILKLKDVYGQYMCDSIMVLQGRVTLRDPSSPRVADVNYKPASLTITKSLEKEVFDTARPAAGTLMRVIVFDHMVLLLDEAKNNILIETRKQNVRAEIPPSGIGAAGVPTEDDKLSSQLTPPGSDRSKSDQSSAFTRATTTFETKSVSKNSVRIVFYDTSEVYYFAVRPGRGGDRTTLLKCVAEEPDK